MDLLKDKNAAQFKTLCFADSVEGQITQKKFVFIKTNISIERQTRSIVRETLCVTKIIGTLSHKLIIIWTQT